MEKDYNLDASMIKIERAFGKGSIMRLGQNPNVDFEAISTGSLGIDIALGIGALAALNLPDMPMIVRHQGMYEGLNATTMKVFFL